MTSQSGYGMPYIKDKALYAAVMFARKLIREDGVPPGAAIVRAAKYYDVWRGDVAHFVGIAASRVKARKARRGPGPLQNTMSA